MIYLTRDNGYDAPPDIAAVEDARRAEAYEAQGYERCTYDAFLDAWWVRDQWQAWGMLRPCTVTAPIGSQMATIGPVPSMELAAHMGR